MPSKPFTRLSFYFRLILVLLTVVLTVLFLAVREYQYRRDLNRLLARIEALDAAGVPLTPAQLMEEDPLNALARNLDLSIEGINPPNPSRSATHYYLAALALVDFNSFTSGAIMAFNAAFSAYPYVVPSPADLALAAELLEANAMTLDMLDRATDLPLGMPIAFNYRFMNQQVNRTESINAVRELDYLLGVRGKKHILDGHHAQAYSSATAWIRLSRVFPTRTIALEYLVKFGFQSRVSAFIAHLLQYAPLTHDQLQQLDQELIAHGPTLDDTYNMLLAERVMILQHLALHLTPFQAALNRSRDVDPRLRLNLNDFQTTADQLIKFLDYMDQASDAAKVAYPDRIRAFEALTERYRPFIEGGTKGFGDYDKFVEFNATTLALHRSARTLIAIQRYRLDHEGQLPASLEELVPEYLDRVPQDPFTGTALAYRVDPDSYAVYSLWRDGVDNDGQQNLRLNGEEHNDFGYRIYLAETAETK